MALRKQNITIPLAASLDESKDDVLLENQVLPSVTNAQYVKHGRVSKSPGFSAKSRPFEDGASLKDAHLIRDFKGAPLMAGFVDEGSGVTDYDKYFQLAGMDETESKLRELGDMVPIRQTVRQCGYSQEYMCSPDIAESNGYEFIVWENRGVSATGTPLPHASSWITIVEQDSGVVVLPPTHVGGVWFDPRIKPHVVACGDVVLMFFCDIGNNIYCAVWDATDPTTVPTPSAIITDFDNSANFDYLYDVCSVEDATYGNCAAVAYRESGGGTLYIKIVDNTGTIQRNGGEVGVEPVGAITIKEIRTTAHSNALAYATLNDATGDIEYQIYEDSTMAANAVKTTTIIAPINTTLEQITIEREELADMTNGAIRVFMGCYYDDGSRPFHLVRTARLGVTAATHGIIDSEDVPWWHYQLISKAFNYKSIAHAWLHCDVAIAPRAALVCPGYVNDDDECMPRGEALALLNVSRAQTRECFLGQVLGVASSELAWVAIKDEYDTGLSVERRTVSYDVKNPGCASFNESLQIGSGYQHLYDGTCQDVGFAHPPFIHDLSADAAGGNLQDGLYAYVATYEWTDGNGDWHVSQVSSASTLDASSKDAGELVIWTQQFGHMPKLDDRTRVCVYRTLVDGDVFYYVGFVHNDPESESVNFYDDKTDDEIAANRQLYTTGGELENGTPPPGVNIVSHLDRIWILDEDNPRRIAYSKPQEINIAASYSPLQYVVLPEDGVALAAQGDYVYAFTASKIYGISGAGPDKLGNGSFAIPRLVVNDVGCSNRRSIVHSDLGIFFQSSRGIYLLSAGAVHCVSDAVEDSLGSNSVIAGLVESEEKRVRFLLDNGTQLVYDFGKQRWSVWTGYTNAVMFGELGGSVHHQDSSNNLYYEAGTFRHSSTSYAMEIESPWIHLSSLTGFQRIWWVNVLGTWKSGHKMKVELYTDYSESAAKQSVTFTCTTSLANYTLRIKPQYQKCKALKVKISDLTTDQVTPYSSADLHALELTVGVKSAYNRNPGKAG